MQSLSCKYPAANLDGLTAGHPPIPFALLCELRIFGFLALIASSIRPSQGAVTTRHLQLVYNLVLHLQ